MLTRFRFTHFAALTLSTALLGACVASPTDTAQLTADQPLSQRSNHGLVEATVSLTQPEIARGPNDFSIALSATNGASSPLLTSVEASMAAHGHHASAVSIDSDGQAFRAVGLDLFMSGVWQIALGVELDDRSDVVEFSLDVP